MSGGHFDYAQYKIGHIAADVEQLIINNDDETKDQYGDTKGNRFSKETIEEFKRAFDLLRQAEVYTQRIDWLVSGDDGEESFHKRLAHDLRNAKEFT